MFKRVLAALVLAAATLTTGAVSAGTAHADTTYRGEGDEVVRVRLTKTPGLLQLRHDGEANFIVFTVTPAGKKEELLVNEIGPYSGTVLYNARAGMGTAALEIKADGAWSAVFKPLSKARCWCTGTVHGTGDQVLKLSPTRGLRTVRSSFTGEGNFIVQSYTRPGSYGDLLFNQIGSYKGKALLPSGTRLVTVHADGSWSLTRN
ncbi:hypothetical protein GCM10027187_35520 [Streptosporangium sandarakinum]|uniref:Uncharacterized protein n=1 Tax=Streptosporangium sandarakinum TaxID=1260955 RepID=A0A852V710_9ACTN|nr:hypothetical protein [Streptosporangium sandarakinum]NYF43890.1 hypothetical protein [Streptosporangium sandarakinum]